MSELPELPQVGQLWRKTDCDHAFHIQVYAQETTGELTNSLDETFWTDDLVIKDHILVKPGDVVMVIETMITVMEESQLTTNGDKVLYVHVRLLVGERLGDLTYLSRGRWHEYFQRMA